MNWLNLIAETDKFVWQPPWGAFAIIGVVFFGILFVMGLAISDNQEKQQQQERQKQAYKDAIREIEEERKNGESSAA